MNEKVETELKELILDENFNRLQNLANEEVNLMEILGVAHKELQHSNFLAWFFNPNQSHNLKDFVIKEFIKIYFKENQYRNLGDINGLSVFDFVNLNFEDLEIKREYHNIDLILLSRKNEFCIVIENKIYSYEKYGQLEKYRKFIENEYPDYKHKIYIYLSLIEQDISESERDYYIQLNYDHIIKLIEQVLSSYQIKLSDKTQFVFEQYLQTLKSMLNKNSEIEIIVNQLYKKYKSAFDLVYKYSAVSNNVIYNILQNLIENEDSIKSFKSDKNRIRFQPNFLYENLESLQKKGLVAMDDDLTDNWVFLFEFHLRDNKVLFDIKIGAGEPECRLKLYEVYKNHGDFFTKVEKANGLLRPQWHQAFQKQIVSSTELEKYDENDDFDINSIIERKFKELILIDLPNFYSILREELIEA